MNWRNGTNKTGTFPVYLRITIERVAKYYRIKIPQNVSPADWDPVEDSWVKLSHPFAFEINNKIIEKKNIVRELIKKAYTFNKSLDFETIFRHLNRKGEISSFYDYFRDYIKNPPEKLELNTIKKYETALRHLEKFRKKMYFSDIDNALIKEFYKYMQIDLKLVGSTCKKYLDAIKRVIKQARKDHYMDPSQMEFLFEDVKVRVNRAKRVFLEPAEIKAWKNAPIPFSKPWLTRDRDLFLFQIYTGFYYKDFLGFTKDQLLEDEQYGYIIVGARDKNDNQTIIPLFKFPYAANVIRKYRSASMAPEVFEKKNFIEEQGYNRNLKEIAGLCGITKSVSNKVARHTNAQLWVRYGAERPILSKMMGHTTEETTKHYFEVNIPEVVEGTRKVDFGRLGI